MKLITNKRLFTLNNLFEDNGKIIIIGSFLVYLISSLIHQVFYCFYGDNFIQPLTSFLKLIFELFFLGILLSNFKKKRMLFVFLGGFFVVFLIGELLVAFDVNSQYNFFTSLTAGNFFYFNKYMYPFIFLGAFSLSKSKEDLVSSYFNFVEKVLIFNALLIFIGFLFSIECFQSYPHSSRFGYSGILERVFFVFLSMIVILRKTFLNKIDLSLLILTVAVLLSGTKVVILFFILFLFFYLYEKKRIKGLLLATGFLISGIIFLKPIVNFGIRLFPFWQSILDEKGYISLLSSKRDTLIQNTFDYLRLEGTLFNLFFGGLDFLTHWTEVDFIDLFLFFGLMGGILYLVLLSKIINKSYHLVPFLIVFFTDGLFLAGVIMSTYLLWAYESNLHNNKVF